MSILKPIFHCDANFLVSGVGVGHCPRCQNFGLEIPTCWYVLALPNAKICITPDAKPRICGFPDAKPQHQSVEYRWRWVIWCWPCIFHVYFMYISCIFHVYFMYISCIFHVYFIYISCCLCIIFRVGYAKISRRKGSFQWNMGFRSSHVALSN